MAIKGELKYTCKRAKVKGYSKMDREQLIAAVKEVIRTKLKKE